MNYLTEDDLPSEIPSSDVALRELEEFLRQNQGFDHRVGHFLAPAGRRRPTTPVSSGAEGLVPHREEPGVADAMIKARISKTPVRTAGATIRAIRPDVHRVPRSASERPGGHWS